jgi:ubiquinone/menaquinone biosynthesis C-methylase UbiE
MSKPLHLQDQWAQWLLQRRDGGDLATRQTLLKNLEAYRDQVLAHASLKEGETLLDLGTGTGLIAFGALERLGERGTVIFSDISRDLLDHSRALAEQMGVLERCRFLLAPADDLSALADASVDVITTRSVLIYVQDKQRVFNECYRVLKPGGRISLFEPINRFSLTGADQRFMEYDLAPILPIGMKVLALYAQSRANATNAMLDFDERDLFAFAEKAGFPEVHLDLQAEVKPANPRAWDGFVQSSPNPLVPTLEEAMREALTPEEAERFTAYLRPLVEGGRGTWRMAMAYLWAVKTRL